MERKCVDCRDFPESNCSLKLSGSEKEVLRAAKEHAVTAHGHQDTPELESQIRKMLKDDVEPQKEKTVAA